MINRLAESMNADGAAPANGRVDNKWVGKQAPGRTWVHPDTLLKATKLGL